MKTTGKQLATGTFLALLLLVVNVNAEGTEKKFAVNESIETTLPLEKWMTDVTFWQTNSEIFTELVQETETELEIESWMINDATWNTNNLNKDQKSKIEAWMLNDNYWK